jgi:hypothetical protein
MSATVLTGAAGLFLALVAFTAYQSGRRHGRVTLPAALLDELRDHKVHCIGEPPERVNLEIALLCERDDRTPAPNGLSR